MSAEHEPAGETRPTGDLPSPQPAHVHALSAPVRLVAVALQAIAALNVLYIAAHLAFGIFMGVQTAPPLLLALGLSVFSGVPWAVVALLRRLFTATVELKPPLLLLTLRRARFEIPLASVTALRPFWLPLPGPGVSLQMTSGRSFRYRLGLADPSALLSALGAALPSAQSALGHPSIAYARERYLLAPRRWYFWLAKFGLFPLALTVILFRLDQIITYGGPFGQYHLFGLMPYLKSFAVVWAGTAGGLVVYAGSVRLAVEALALPLSLALPSHARLIRRLGEGLCLLAYFGLVPAVVLILLLR